MTKLDMVNYIMSKGGKKQLNAADIFFNMGICRRMSKAEIKQRYDEFIEKQSKETIQND